MKDQPDEASFLQARIVTDVNGADALNGWDFPWFCCCVGSFALGFRVVLPCAYMLQITGIQDSDIKRLYEMGAKAGKGDDKNNQLVLSKQILDEGSVVFKDVLIKGWELASTSKRKVIGQTVIKEKKQRSLRCKVTNFM